MIHHDEGGEVSTEDDLDRRLVLSLVDRHVPADRHIRLGPPPASLAVDLVDLLQKSSHLGAEDGEGVLYRVPGGDDGRTSAGEVVLGVANVVGVKVLSFGSA